MEEEKKDKKQYEVAEMDAAVVNEMTIVVEGTDGRKYRFVMPFNSPLPECYNASINVAREIGRIFNEAVEKKKQEDKKKEEKVSATETK